MHTLRKSCTRASPMAILDPNTWKMDTSICLQHHHPARQVECSHHSFEQRRAACEESDCHPAPPGSLCITVEAKAS